LAAILGELHQRLFDHHLGRFDRRYDVETAHPLPLSGLTIDSPRADHGQSYRAVPEPVFTAAISVLPSDLTRFTFVDFGAGKGRVLILAARAGFGRVVGVEFAVELFTLANLNIAQFAANDGTSAIDCRLGDAAEFPIPDGPAVFFFYNPFDASVMAEVMANIRAAYDGAPRDMFVLYTRPQFAATVDRTEIFRRVARVRPRTLLRYQSHFETLVYAAGPETG
jgi:SAM-dependent methyltransferase